MDKIKIPFRQRKHVRRLLSAFGLCLVAHTIAQAQGLDPGSATLSVHSRMVVVDVVVNDSHGRPIPHLDQTQFTILEDGKPQGIKRVEEHASSSVSAYPPIKPLPAGVYSNYPSSAPTDSETVLLLDALNTDPRDQAYARLQMLDYLRNMSPGSHLAVFALSSRLRMLQGFSSNPGILAAALKSKRGAPGVSPLSSDAVTGSETADSFNVLAEAGVSADLAAFESERAQYLNDVRTQITIEAFHEIAAYLTGFSGRKSVVWFSGSFPLSLNPTPALSGEAFGGSNTLAEDVARVTNLLADQHVAIYPVDVKGLQAPTAFSVASRGSGRPGALPSSIQNDFQRTAAEHIAMNDLAQSTGGYAIYNTNGLKGALAQIVNDNNNYYSIAYVPTNGVYDGRFRKISVAVAGASPTHLAYRHGYYATNANTSSVSNETRDLTSAQYMRRGAPDTTQILFKTAVRPAPMTIVPPVGEELPAQTKAKQSSIRYRVDWAIDLHAVTFSTTEDHLRHATIRLDVAAYDVDGVTQASDSNELVLTFTPAQYARLLTVGLQHSQTLQLPPGNTFLHLGVLDVTSRNMGSTEIPLRIASIKPPL